MKAYITPIENSCNAQCSFCITRSKRETQFGTVLDPKYLSQLDNVENIDSFEISGGGEPLLHPQINEIIDWCTQRKPTILYTNGSLLSHLDINLAQKLRKLTISQHHYLPSKRQKIMGVRLDTKTLRHFVQNHVYLRFTLVLYKDGIKNALELSRYLDWSQAIGAREVQVRQLFEYTYGNEIENNFVSTNKVLQDLSSQHHLPIKSGKYKTIVWKGIPVEFEGEKCACSDGVPNLRANGQLYQGWTNTKLSNIPIIR